MKSLYSTIRDNSKRAMSDNHYDSARYQKGLPANRTLYGYLFVRVTDSVYNPIRDAIREELR